MDVVGKFLERRGRICDDLNTALVIIILGLTYILMSDIQDIVERI